MPDTTIYHNPRCSKSRATLQLICERGVEPTIIEYLKPPPDAATLDRLLRQLGLEPEALIRSKEEVYEKLGLAEKSLSRQELIEIMIANPILIERPIVVSGEKAVLGRPPENVLTLLNG